MGEEAKGGETQEGGEKKDSVFTKVIKTVSGTTTYEMDGARRDLGALSNAAVANDSALTDIPIGVEQTSIAGNSVRYVWGKRTTLVSNNDILNVEGQEIHTIVQDSQHFYEANRRVVVGNNDTQTVGNRQDLFVIGQSSYQYIGDHELTAPGDFEWKTFERGFTAYKIDLCLFNLDAHLMSIDTHVMDVELAGFKGRGGALEEVLKGQEGKADAIQLEVSIEVDIKGRGDVLVDIGIGTPFR